MVGCRDYPLAVGRMGNGTVYFCTDTKTLFQFTPAMSSVFGNPKLEIFCGTIPQSDDILNAGTNFQAKVSQCETFA
jgi:hypothetical protein